MNFKKWDDAQHRYTKSKTIKKFFHFILVDMAAMV
jgi:hypothetical protein